MNLTVIYYNIFYKSKKSRTNEKYKNTAEIKKCGEKWSNVGENVYL